MLPPLVSASFVLDKQKEVEVERIHHRLILIADARRHFIKHALIRHCHVRASTRIMARNLSAGTRKHGHVPLQVGFAAELCRRMRNS